MVFQLQTGQTGLNMTGGSTFPPSGATSLQV